MEQKKIPMRNQTNTVPKPMIGKSYGSDAYSGAMGRRKTPTMGESTPALPGQPRPKPGVQFGGGNKDIFNKLPNQVQVPDASAHMRTFGMRDDALADRSMYEQAAAEGAAMNALAPAGYGIPDGGIMQGIRDRGIGVQRNQTVLQAQLQGDRDKLALDYLRSDSDAAQRWADLALKNRDSIRSGNQQDRQLDLADLESQYKMYDTDRNYEAGRTDADRNYGLAGDTLWAQIDENDARRQETKAWRESEAQALADWRKQQMDDKLADNTLAKSEMDAAKAATEKEAQNTRNLSLASLTIQKLLPPNADGTPQAVDPQMTVDITAQAQMIMEQNEGMPFEEAVMQAYEQSASSPQNVAKAARMQYNTQYPNGSWNPLTLINDPASLDLAQRREDELLGYNARKKSLGFGNKQTPSQQQGQAPQQNNVNMQAKADMLRQLQDALVDASGTPDEAAIQAEIDNLYPQVYGRV